MALPPWVYFTSGSLPRLPTRMTLLMPRAMVLGSLRSPPGLAEGKGEYTRRPGAIRRNPARPWDCAGTAPSRARALYWQPPDVRPSMDSDIPAAPARPALTLPQVQAYAAADMAAVDALIRRRLASDVVLVNQVAEHIVAGGGKRLRPMLLLLAARALGHQGADAHQLAAVVEFIHTSTLLHDDVVDESDLRRGRSTANAVFGNAASVLVGDFLYSRSFQLMVELGS